MCARIWCNRPDARQLESAGCVWTVVRMWLNLHMSWISLYSCLRDLAWNTSVQFYITNVYTCLIQSDPQHMFATACHPKDKTVSLRAVSCFCATLQLSYSASRGCSSVLSCPINPIMITYQKIPQPEFDVRRGIISCFTLFHVSRVHVPWSQPVCGQALTKDSTSDWAQSAEHEVPEPLEPLEPLAVRSVCKIAMTS